MQTTHFITKMIPNPQSLCHDREGSAPKSNRCNSVPHILAVLYILCARHKLLAADTWTMSGYQGVGPGSYAPSAGPPLFLPDETFGGFGVPGPAFGDGYDAGGFPAEPAPFGVAPAWGYQAPPQLSFPGAGSSGVVRQQQKQQPYGELQGLGASAQQAATPSEAAALFREMSGGAQPLQPGALPGFSGRPARPLLNASGGAGSSSGAVQQPPRQFLTASAPAAGFVAASAVGEGSGSGSGSSAAGTTPSAAGMKEARAPKAKGSKEGKAAQEKRVALCQQLDDAFKDHLPKKGQLLDQNGGSKFLQEEERKKERKQILESIGSSEQKWVRLSYPNSL